MDSNNIAAVLNSTASTETPPKQKRAYHRRPKEETVISIEERNYYTPSEVSQLLGCSKGYAYQVIRDLNAEREKKGFLTIQAKVSKAYFHERFGLEVTTACT